MIVKLQGNQSQFIKQNDFILLIQLTQHFDMKNFNHILNFLVKLKRKTVGQKFRQNVGLLILEFKSRPEKLSLKVDGESWETRKLTRKLFPLSKHMCV